MIQNVENEGPIKSSTERRGVTAREVVYGVLGLVAGLLVLSGVWLMANRADATAAMPQVTEIFRPASEFELETLDGPTVRLSDYRGQIVLLNFWRTDCVPCRAETPALQQAYSDLKDQGVVIIGVNLFNEEQMRNGGIDTVRQFATLYGVSYPIALDADSSVAKAYNIAPIPTSYLIDPDGNIRFVRIGELTTNNVKALVEVLRQNPKASLGSATG